MDRSSPLALQLLRTAGAILTVRRAALAPLADRLHGHAIAAGQHTCGLGRAGDLGPDARGTSSLGVDRMHRDLLAEQGLVHRSEHQAYFSMLNELNLSNIPLPIS